MTERIIADGAIQMHSGKYINLLAPDMEDVDVHDIAHALSNTGRFGGHAKHLYSVAQHCVLGSLKAKNWVDGRDFMFHDASEAYLVDMPTPLKWNLPEYKEIEKMWEYELSAHYGIMYPFAENVHRLDREALATERRDLLHMDGEWDILKGIEPWPEKIHVWHPLYANYRFLKRLREIGIDNVTVPSPLLPVAMQIAQRVIYKFL